MAVTALRKPPGGSQCQPFRGAHKKASPPPPNHRSNLGTRLSKRPENNEKSHPLRSGLIINGTAAPGAQAGSRTISGST